MFLNRNTKDFGDPDIKARLGQVSCDLVGGFDAGLTRVKHALTKAGATRPPNPIPERFENWLASHRPR